MKSNKFKESQYYQDWLVNAGRDADTAFLNHRHNGYTDTTCYFCHQTAEKSLKSYLLFRGEKSLPYTHILTSLLVKCSKYDKDFIVLKENCDILNGYYIETKYPAMGPVDYPREEASAAIKLADEIYDFVVKKTKTS